MIFREKYLRSLLFLLLLSPFYLKAQEAGPSKKLRGSIKISLLDMIDPAAPAFMLAVERSFSPRFGVQVEGGFISSFGGDYGPTHDLKGYKFRGELRFYEGAGFTNNNFSWGPQFMFKRDESKDSDTFLRADGAYFQKIDFTNTRTVMAMHFHFNGMMPMGKTGVLEIGGWLGLRRLDRKFQGLPKDVEREVVGVVAWTEPGVHYFPSLGLALRMGLAW